VSVLSWNEKHPVRIPAALLPKDLAATIAIGQYLTASVNTGAQRAEDLFFEDLQPAPEPVAEDRFGAPHHP